MTSNLPPPPPADDPSVIPTEDDPFGIAARLRGLPDPGPMPADVEARIRAALADVHEQRLHGDAVLFDVPDAPAPVVPLTAARRRRLAEWRHGTGSGTGSGTGTNSSPSAARRPWILGAAAAAAAVAIGVGWTTIYNQRHPLDAGAAVVPSSVSTPSRTAPIQPNPSTTGTTDPTTSPDPGVRRGETHIQLTTTAYTHDTLLTLAARTYLDRAAPLLPTAAEAPGIGPIGTPLGASGCAQALGIPNDVSIVIDLATFNGQPAAIVIAPGPMAASATDGSQAAPPVIAFAVARSCSLGSPHQLD